MLFMLIVKSSKTIEEGNPPSPELMKAMDDYNEKLMAAGVRVMAEGLRPSSDGLRIAFPKEGEPVITQGPFTDNLIAGFILINVASRDEAIRWARQMPDPIGNGEGLIELRQLYEEV